jgi:hypothetical protein
MNRRYFWYCHSKRGELWRGWWIVYINTVPVSIKGLKRRKFCYFPCFITLGTTAQYERCRLLCSMAYGSTPQACVPPPSVLCLCAGPLYLHLLQRLNLRVGT